jgi:glycosyltransferase involved in cell wall biosynthesis
MCVEDRPTMRVALIAHQYPPAVGGVERHVAELAAGFMARGIGVEVVTCDPTLRLPTHAVEDGVLVHRFPTVADDAVFFVSPLLGLWLLRNARRFSLLHAHSYHTPLALQALVAARVARRPFVLTPHYHGTGHSFARRALHIPYRVVGRAIVRRSRPLICVSRAEQALLQRHFGQDLKTVIAPNGVDVDEILHAQPLDTGRRNKVILTAGRLEHYKRVERVVEAMQHLPEDHELVVLGTGPAQAAIIERARQLGLSDRVHLLGHVPTPLLHGWFRTADVFVTLSRHEAFGITLLEAGVAGAGVVASDIPAHREVAEYLAPGAVTLVPGDAPLEELAVAIGRAGRRDVVLEDVSRVPTWADTVEGTLDAYDIATGRSPNRPWTLRTP